MGRATGRQRGFTYLGLLILVAILALVGAAGLKMGSLLQRQAAEQELLAIGAQFSDALYSYAAATPPGQPQQPPSLEALLRDPRVPQMRRHLRKRFVDPLTGRAEWGLVFQPGGDGIIGIHSLSQSRPLKVGNFEARFAGFEGKEKLSEWLFQMPVANLPPEVPATPAPENVNRAQGPLFSRPVVDQQEKTAADIQEPALVPSMTENVE